MTLSLLRKLVAYRLSAVLVTTAVSFAVLLRGLTASLVLSETSWPSPLREQALTLAAISIGIGPYLILVLRRPDVRLLPAPLVAIAVLSMVAFGFSGVIGAIAVVTCCFIIGHAVETTLGAGRLATPIDTTVVGLAALMLLLVIVNVLRLPMVPVLWAVLFGIGAYAIGARTLWERGVEIKVRLRSVRLLPRPSWPTVVPLALGIFALLFITGLTALREGGGDALAVHLLVSTQILTFGQWNLDPHQFAFAVMPAAVDFAYTFAFLLGGEMATRLLNLFVLFGILAQIETTIRPLYGRSAASLAILLFVSIPTVLMVTASLFVENTIALLTITSVRLLLQQNSAACRSASLGLGITVGALCAAKLHGVILALPIVALAAFGQDYSRLSRRDWRTLLAATVVCLVLGAMPYIVSALKTGDPVFPFQNALFKSPYYPPVNFDDSRWTGHFSPLLIYRMTFMSTNYLEAGLGALGFAFVAFLGPGVIAGLFRPRREIVICLIVSIFFGVVVTSQSQYIRYLYPIFPLMVVVCSASIAQLAAVRIWRRPTYAATVLVAALGIYKLPAGTNANLAAVFSSNLKDNLVVPHRLVNSAINALADKPRVIYATVAPFGAFLKGTPIYVEWYNTALWMALDSAKTAEDVDLIIDRLNADFIVTDAAINPTHYMAARHAKVVAYAHTHADLVAVIGGLSIFRIRRP